MRRTLRPSFCFVALLGGALALMLGLSAAGCSRSGGPVLTGPPAGWELFAFGRSKFEAGRVEEPGGKAKTFALLRSRETEQSGPGLLLQRCAAGAFRGKRLEFSALVRTRAAYRAGLWVGAEKDGFLLSYDDMWDRMLRGDTEWQRVVCVVDVPADAQSLIFGLLLLREGEAAIADVSLREVPRSRSLTGTVLAQTGRPPMPAPLTSQGPPAPRARNLNFSE